MMMASWGVTQGWVPALATAAAVIALIWLAVRLLGRWLGRWTHQRAATRVFRATLIACGVVAAALVALEGTGWTGQRLSWPQVVGWLTGPGLRILFILAGAYIAIRITDFFIAHLESVLVGPEIEIRDAAERRKRIETMGRLLRGLATLILGGMAGLMVLREVNIDITPVLTGAGVLGVAIGFGAQSLVKDLISGVFLILENQIRVGDVVTINGKTGLVEALQLRIIVLRGEDGAVHIFHNGAVTEYTNLTKDYAYAVLELSVPYKEDVGRVTAALTAIGHEMQQDPGFAARIQAPLEVLGIESLGAAAVGLRVRMRTVPMEQWTVDRELRRRVKAQFEAEGIALA